MPTIYLCNFPIFFPIFWGRDFSFPGFLGGEGTLHLQVRHTDDCLFHKALVLPDPPTILECSDRVKDDLASAVACRKAHSLKWVRYDGAPLNG